MKHNLYFLVIVSLIANLCIAMQTLQITKELPALKHKRYISFLTDEELIIQGKETWDIIDSKTHKTIKILDNTPDSAKIDIHPNQKTFMIFGKDKINIYDTKTKELISRYLSKEEIQLVRFNPLDNNNIYIMAINPTRDRAVIKRDYRSNTNLVLYDATYYENFCAHPTHASLCYLVNENVLHLPHDKNIVGLPLFPPHDIFYNPDGTAIIAYNKSCLITIDASALKLNKWVQRNTQSISFKDAKMYSNNLLALLVTKEITKEDGNSELLQIKFCNIAELSPYIANRPSNILDPQPQPLLAQTEKIEIEMIGKREQLHTFSFSPNGKQCMVGFHHKALVFDIPFEVTYEADTKEKLEPIYRVLRHNEFPNDIINILIKMLLTMHKR